MENKKIEIKSARPERYFSKNYHDFMDSTLLNGEEKIIFLSLKRFLDIRTDRGNIYPTIETIQKMTGWGKQKVINNIKNLIKKGVLKKIRQGLNKPNIYVIADEAEMWNAKNIDELKELAAESEIEKSIRILKANGYTVTKEKEPVSEPSKAHTQALKNNYCSNEDSTSQPEKSQDLERYTIEQIHQLFDYDIMLIDNPFQKRDIDSVMDVLHTAMNTSKPVIRIAGQDKPAMAVIGKLMKLDKESIMYAIRKFSEQTDRIKNPVSYMLTILYHAPEQYHLDIENRVSHDMMNPDML